MRWIKQGRIFEPTGVIPWITSHSAVPIPYYLGADRFRVYFSARDECNRAHVAYIEIDITSPTHILAWSERPVLNPGPPGNFDDSGAMSDWILRRGDDLYLYYTGWNRGVTVPFRNSIGLARSRDGGRSFLKQYEGPVLDRSIYDPCFLASACVLLEESRARLWYVSGVRWEKQGGALKHYYHIKYAESADGIVWDRKGHVCIDFCGEEYVTSRPCVIREADGYKMWYSHRGDTYRIGYAESPDGLEWQRKDHLVGIDVSESGWDSEMIEYAYVFDHADRRYMLYNGNGYGKSGIGLAILDV